MSLYTRALDPQTGQLAFSEVQHTWTASAAPMREIVVRALRTPKGQCLAAPNFGLDFTGLDKVSPRLARTFEAAVQSALLFLTAPGLITDLRTNASVERAGLVYEVVFRDPRAPTNPHRIRDRLAL